MTDDAELDALDDLPEGIAGVLAAHGGLGRPTGRARGRRRPDHQRGGGATRTCC